MKRTLFWRRFIAILALSSLLLSGGVYVYASDDSGMEEEVKTPFHDVQASKDISVSARAAVLIEARSGEIVYAKNADETLPMASTTKIMTAIIAVENASLETVVSISDKAIGIEGTSVYLARGEKLTVRELLYAVLLQSANDASYALAIAVGGTIDNFVAMMNEKAKELGLSHTHFANPHGLPAEGHYSSAYDLAKLFSYCMKNEVFREITSTYKTSISHGEDRSARLLINHNKLLKTYEGTIGGKTGYTKASGRCLVTACERDGVRLIAATLNAPSDWQDHTALYDYGFSLYERVTLDERAAFRYESPVVGGTFDRARAVLSDDVTVTVKKDFGEVDRVIEMEHFYYPPIKKGDVIGALVYYQDGKEFLRVPLYADYAVAAETYEKSWFESLWGFFFHR